MQQKKKKQKLVVVGYNYFVKNEVCMVAHNDSMDFVEVPTAEVAVELLDYYTNAYYNVSYIIAADSEKHMDLKIRNK